MKYTVIVPEISYEEYGAEADDEQEALRLVLIGEGIHQKSFPEGSAARIDAMLYDVDGDVFRATFESEIVPEV